MASTCQHAGAQGRERRRHTDSKAGGNWKRCRMRMSTQRSAAPSIRAWRLAKWVTVQLNHGDMEARGCSAKRSPRNVVGPDHHPDRRNGALGALSPNFSATDWLEIGRLPREEDRSHGAPSRDTFACDPGAGPEAGSRGAHQPGSRRSFPAVTTPSDTTWSAETDWIAHFWLSRREKPARRKPEEGGRQTEREFAASLPPAGYAGAIATRGRGRGIEEHAAS